MSMQIQLSTLVAVRAGNLPHPPTPGRLSFQIALLSQFSKGSYSLDRRVLDDGPLLSIAADGVRKGRWQRGVKTWS